jgi:iron complex transport system substrate-binding protein
VTRPALASLTAVLLLASAAVAADKRTVTDAAGRRVEVPARIERVYAAGGPASVLLYALAPEKLLGWTRPPTPEERAYLPGRYAGLPTLGRLTGRGNTANVEVVLRARPDIVLDYGSVTATYVSLADRVQQQTGVPYLLFDGRLSAIPDALLAVGDLLGLADRAAELARYAERVLADTDRRVAAIPPEKRPVVYYARGPRGLETASKGSINVESLERLGARSAAGAGAGLAAVSIEQVLAWDPEVIIAMDPAFGAEVRVDPRWRDVRAVRERRVHVVPQHPFPWVDFPPSVNRLIGLRWLGQVLYPDRFGEDIREEARAFYALFYHQAPSDALLGQLLGGRGHEAAAPGRAKSPPRR